MVGVDGSEGSADALRWTIALARSTGAEVIAVHAFKVPYSAPPATGFALVPKVEVWAESVQRTFVETWCAPLRDSGIAYRTVFRTGPADLVLVEVADETVADLVGTGRRGLTSLVGLLAGSVSQHLIHRAHCPVVVLPLAAQAEKGAHQAAAHA